MCIWNVFESFPTLVLFLRVGCKTSQVMVYFEFSMLVIDSYLLSKMPAKCYLYGLLLTPRETMRLILPRKPIKID